MHVPRHLHVRYITELTLRIIAASTSALGIPQILTVISQSLSFNYWLSSTFTDLTTTDSAERPAFSRVYSRLPYRPVHCRLGAGGGCPTIQWCQEGFVRHMPAGPTTSTGSTACCY